MNFTASARQGGGGFYEEDSPRGILHPLSTCSSAPSSSIYHHRHHQRGRLVPSSYHQHQQPQRPSWDDQTTSSFPAGYSGGAGGTSTQQLELMMMDSSYSSSPARNNNHLHLNNMNNVVENADDTDEQFGEGRGRTSNAAAAMIEKEHMFDKVVTPSDVGKLNRLVIPKQHAEKYFPLDSSTNEKGLLLNFEDRNGKPWRFRYSYWNSSQSYVITKGWSRFVKEKKLDAGDIVSFQRGVGELGKDRLFIDWRRRPDAPEHHHHHHHHLPPSMSTLSLPHQFSFHHPWNHHPFYLQQQQHHHHQIPRDEYSRLLQVNATNNTSIINNCGYTSTAMTGNHCSSGPIIYVRSSAATRQPQHLGFGLGTVQLHKGSSSGLNPKGEEEEEEEVPLVFESVPVVQGKAAAKRLRLFGVNMDCPFDQELDDGGIVLPSTALPHSTMPSQNPHFSSSPSSIANLQLRPHTYDSPMNQTMPFQCHLLDNNKKKGKVSMSLDLDI